MHLCPPRCDERVADPDDLRPVKGEYAQPQAIVNSEYLVEDDIVGCDPAYPVEDR